VSAAYRVVRNSAWAVAGEAVGGTLLFVAFVVVARYLGSHQFGVFSFLLAIVALAQVVADFGLTTILVRDMARDKLRAAQMCSSAMSLVSGISVALLLAAGPSAYWLADSTELLWTCLMMACAAAVSFSGAVFAAVCRAHEEMAFNAAANLIQRLLFLLFSGIAVALDGGMARIALAYLLANLLQALFFYCVVRRRYFAVRWRPDVHYSVQLLLEAVPVGVAIVLRRSTILTGTLVLTALSTPHAVGLFNAAMRIIQMLELLPSTLSAPLLPPLARLGSESSERLFRTLRDAMRIFAILGLPVCAWAFVCAPQIMQHTFGSSYAGPALRILSLAVLLIFLTSLYVGAFSALGQQRLQTLATAFGLATAVGLNLLLVPWIGERGAAAALVAAECVFFATGLMLLRARGFSVSLRGTFGKPAAAAVVTAPILLLLWHLDSLAGLLAVSLAYVCVYGVAVVALKAVSREELAFLKSAFRLRFSA
jgi:O-antigen/teichoic acid export membrane protein